MPSLSAATRCLRCSGALVLGAIFLAACHSTSAAPSSERGAPVSVPPAPVLGPAPPTRPRAVVAVIIDQLGSDRILQHLRQAYPVGYSAEELAADKSTLVTLLYVLTGLAVVGWFTALGLVRRRSRWATPVTVVLFVVGGLTTTAGLWVHDEGYGRPLPTWLALAFAAPAVAGLVAVVALLRRWLR